MNINVSMTRKENAAYHGVPVGGVVSLDIEEYLKGVVPAEVYENRTPHEALRAQAICARTYALRKARDAFTINDTVAYQAYRAPLIEKSPRCREAIRATKGQVLLYRGKLIECYYSNTNMGETKRTDQVWKKALPYYINQVDQWDIAGRGDQKVKAGHGIGLSQIGAEWGARIGVKCPEILAFYYPGTVVEQA